MRIAGVSNVREPGKLIQIRRRGDVPRSKVLTLNRITRAEREAVLSAVVDYPEGIARPKTRADCLPGGDNAERPCPFASCRHHLALDVDHRGHMKINHPATDVADLRESCVLDIADRGGATLHEVGEIMNITRERIRQLEGIAMRRLLARAAWLKRMADGDETEPPREISR